MLSKGRVSNDLAGIAKVHDLIGRAIPVELDEDPEVIVGIETDRGLLVRALVAVGYRVLAVNPLGVDRCRDRHRVSGAESDPGDAKVLADMVRTDAHQHRPVAADSELAEAIKLVARSHQSAIWSRRRLANQVRSALRGFYPAALGAFDDVAHADAVSVLGIAPTPELGKTLSLSKIAAALRRGGRQRHQPPDRRVRDQTHRAGLPHPQPPPRGRPPPLGVQRDHPITRRPRPL